jgi:hypothetical protein
MKQKEAIEKALQELGGRATLQDIYPLAMEYGDFSGSQKPKNTIRNCLQKSPKSFRPSPGMPKGWWELVSYQEEIARLNQHIKKLKSKVEEQNREIGELKRRPTVDDFVGRLVSATKKLFGINRKHADYVRQVLLKLGRDEEQEELLLWIEHKEKKPLKKESKIIQNISNSQIFNGQVKESEFNSGGSNHAG